MFTQQIKDAVSIKKRRLARIKRLKERFYKDKFYVDSERAVLVTDSYKKTEGEPIVVRRAKALKNILENIRVYILPDELIVGHAASKPRSAQVFPEMAVDWLERELDQLETRSQDPFIVPEKVKQDLRSIFPYWKGRTLNDHLRHRLPEETRRQLYAPHPVIFGWCAFQNGIGHICQDYEGVLKKGLNGIKEEACRRYKQLDWSQPENIEKEAFLRSIMIVCDAAVNFGKRYAHEAMNLAAKEADHQRKKELKRIADVCTHVPGNPARNFHEALQSLWFVVLITQLETNGVSISPGRFDQYMFPYYSKDLNSGLLDKEEALELLECLWIKFAEMVILYDKISASYLTNFVMGEHITLGGQLEDGSDATNELSYLCLQAQRDVGLMQPNLSARWHKGSPRKFMLETCRTIRDVNAIPQILNDEVFVPSLCYRGIPIQESRDYSPVGCNELDIAGKTGGLLVTPVSVAKVIELVLNNGKCRLCGRQLGPKTGDPTEFRSFEDVMNAYKKQIKFFVKQAAITNNVEALVHSEVMPVPFVSATIKGCIESGKDMTAGGTEYYYSGSFPGGIANLGNSLMAIKKLVFDDHEISMKELLKALDENFENQEFLRQKLIHKVPKYGNDLEEVDRLTARAIKIFTDELEQYKDWRGGKLLRSYWPAFWTVTANIPFGWATGATPDGRMAKTPLAEGISPAQGTDTSGPTAAMKSVAKIDHYVATMGVIYNMQVSPELLDSDEKLWKFVELIRTYFQLGGAQIQFNIVSDETLRAAQREPQHYRHLLVRVSGYGALFVELSKTVQDDIIARTEQKQLV